MDTFACRGQGGVTDLAAVRDEWRTVPTDLGGWANRANAMLALAERYQSELAEEKPQRKDTA